MVSLLITLALPNFSRFLAVHRDAPIRHWPSTRQPKIAA